LAGFSKSLSIGNEVAAPAGVWNKPFWNTFKGSEIMNSIFTFRVKESDRRDRGGSLALITLGQLLCIPVLMVGGMLGEGMSLGGLLFCGIAGGLILLGCACFMGIQSSRSGLPSTIVSAEGLGVMGARYISALLLTVTSVGWFGIQAAVCGASFGAMAADALGFSVPAWAATLFWGLVMTLSAMYGYRVLKSFYSVMMPVLFVLLVFTFVQVVFLTEAGSATALLVWRPERPMSYITGITTTVGIWAMGSFTAGDYCRYVKNSRAVALGFAAGLLPALLLGFLGGAAFRIVTGTPDITVLLNGLGFPAMALVFLIISVWTINMMNAYFGGIALSVLLGHGEKRLMLNTVLTGIVGTALGAAGILSRFTDFLSLLSSIVPPLIGTLMGVKLAETLKRRVPGRTAPAIPGKPAGEGIKSGFHIPGVIAYGCGAFTAWLTTGVVPFFIPPLNGIIAAAVVYVIPDLILGRKRAKADPEQ
jgi:cytosine permease